MKWPPYLMYLKLRFRGRGGPHGFGLWIPLFILGPIALIFLLALFIIALPFLLLSLLFTWRIGWWRWAWFGVAAFCRILVQLPGLKVRVDDRATQVHIAIY